MHYAVASKNPAAGEIISLLAKEGALLDVPGAKGRTPLMLAASGGRTAVAALLIESGADSNAKDSLGYTALGLALQRNVPVETVAALLVGKPDLEQRDQEGRTLFLQGVAVSGMPAVLDLLMRSGADIAAKDGKGRSALRQQGVAGQVHKWLVTIWLSNPKVRPLSIDDFLAICLSGNPDDVEAAMKIGGDVRARNERGTTALALVVSASPLIPARTVTLMLEAGADVNARDSSGMTPLLLAVLRGNADVIPVLLKAGANGDAITDTGHTAMSLAARSWNPDVVAALAAGGLAVDMPYLSGGWTPLMLAVFYNEHLEVTVAFIVSGAAVDAKSNLGITPLMLSAMAETEAAKKMAALLQAGADAKAANAEGKTVLMYAAEHAGPEEVAMVLAAKADPHAVDNKGRNGMEYAQKNTNPAVAKQLRAAMQGKAGQKK